VVYEVNLDTPRQATEWLPDEELTVIGPETVDSKVSVEMLEFLGGNEAVENLEGVRNGDRLFVVASTQDFQHCGYILFHTRQTRILGEDGNPPLIASCLTAPAARGRGLYRRALNAELCYLREQGFHRVVIETDPENIASRKGIEAAGFRLCRRTSAWIFLNWVVWQKLEENSGTRWRMVSI
jgi:RimJ/RimL family protein N-acetyltransferase